jgi:hypothetical protein
MAIAADRALGMADLPGLQGFQSLREQPVAAFGNAAQPNGNEPLGEFAKESS